MNALLSRLSVGGKLSIGFGAMLLVIVLMGSFATIELGRVYENGHQIVVYNIAGVRDALSISEAATRYRVREYRLLLSTSDEDRKVTIGRLGEGLASVNKFRKSYEDFIANEEERALYKTFAAAWDDYLTTSKALQDKAAAGDVAGATALAMGESLKKFDVAMKAAHTLSDYNDKAATDADQAAGATYKSVRNWIIGSLLLALGGAALLGWMIRTAVVPPLQRALTLAREVADGNLTHTLDAQGQDEVAQLTRALGGMVARLRELVGEVRLGVESVSTASSEIATGNHDLSARTEQAASNLQETASSMEHLTTTVSQAADTARQANQLAGTATQAAQRGGDVVTQVVSNMDQITASSKKISDIISVIDGIAFQTNILALNAAVEAARAGEQGRGFAVVASEVRSLAQRSANAAKEIKTLIGASVETVESGAKLVGDAGQAMQDIMQSVQRVSDLMAEISAATNEQRDGIGQVNTAVTHLDQMTQQNAALVEESAAAASSLSEQAARLNQVVSIFNVGAAQAHAAVAKAAPARTVAAKPAVSAAVKAAPKLPAPVKSAAPAQAREPVAAPVAAASPAGGESDWETF